MSITAPDIIHVVKSHLGQHHLSDDVWRTLTQRMDVFLKQKEQPVRHTGVYSGKIQKPNKHGFFDG